MPDSSLPECLAKQQQCLENETTSLLPHSNQTSPQHHSTELTGYFYMMVSCIGFSGMSFLVHLAEKRHNFPITTSVFIRGIFHTFLSILYIALYLPFRQTFANISATQWKLLAYRGLAGGIGVSLFFTGLRKLPVGDAVTLFFSGPVMVIILSHIFLNEPITPIDCIAAITSFVGIALISRPDKGALITESVSDRIIGVLLITGSAFLASVAYVIIRSMGARIHFILSVLALGFFTLVLSIFLGGALGPMGLIERKEGSLLVALSAVSAFMGQCCLTKGLQLCRAGPGVLMRNLDVPIAHVLGILFLSESPTLLRLFGSTLVLLSAIMIGVRQIVRA